MSITVDLATHREAKELVREFEKVSRQLATYSLTAELAAARRDWVAVHDAAEVVKSLSARFAELRTTLLIKGVS